MKNLWEWVMGRGKAGGRGLSPVVGVLEKLLGFMLQPNLRGLKRRISCLTPFVLLVFKPLRQRVGIVLQRQMPAFRKRQHQWCLTFLIPRLLEGYNIHGVGDKPDNNMTGISVRRRLIQSAGIATIRSSANDDQWSIAA